jgi:phage gpG-like protein
VIKGELLNGDGLVSSITQRVPALQAKNEALVMRLTIETQRLAKQLAPHKTGRLQRSINSQFTGQGSNVVTGTVGTNVEYARVQEYGGPVTIRAHQRMMTMAWGKPVKNPRKIDVREHVANYPEQSYLRAALAMMSGVIAQDFAALARA